MSGQPFFISMTGGMVQMDMDWAYLIQCLIKIGASVVSGCILGLERKSRHQVVGMRTLILISVSSTLLAILSSSSGLKTGGDPTRIAAGVVSGIGFLGGGAILRQGLNIKGLTSAAIIWTSAALGLAIGSGLYLQSAFVLVVVIVLLVVLEKIEEKWFPATRSKTLHLVFENDRLDMSRLKSAITKYGFSIADLNMSRVMASHQIILHYSVKAPREDDFSNLIEELKQIGDLTEFSITD